MLVQEWQEKVLGYFLHNAGELGSLSVRSGWSQAPSATLVQDSELGNLGPMAFKTLGSTKTTGNTFPLGGMCTLFTGDTQYLYQGRLPDGTGLTPETFRQWMWSNMPRLDQVHDTVGSAGFYVVEDSLFGSRIAGRAGNLAWAVDFAQIIREHHQRRVRPIIERWLSLFSNSEAMAVAYTSEFEPDIWLKLAKLRPYLRGDFNDVAYAPVLLMYTHQWPELLRSYGYVNGEAMRIFEPYHHFIMQPAELEVFEPYFWNHQYGKPGLLKDLHIAGFLPAWSIDGDTRSKSYTEIYSWGNWQEVLKYRKRWLEDNDENVFPLNKCPVIWDAINYLFWDECIRSSLNDLVEIENEYQRAKGSIPKPNGRPTRNEIEALKERSAQIKREFSNYTMSTLNAVVQRLEEVIMFVFAGDEIS